MCFTSLWKASSFLISINSGSYKYFFKNGCKDSGMVAEKTIIWTFLSIFDRISSISSKKPNSNVISASSITTILAVSKRKTLSLINMSFILPGVPMTICGCFSICVTFSIPPVTNFTRTLKCLAILRQRSYNWYASSLVGAEITACTQSWSKSSISKIGIKKACDFPDPVLDTPMISLFLFLRFNTCSWMGVKVLKCSKSIISWIRLFIIFTSFTLVLSQNSSHFTNTKN